MKQSNDSIITSSKATLDAKSLTSKLTCVLSSKLGRIGLTLSLLFLFGSFLFRKLELGPSKLLRGLPSKLVVITSSRSEWDKSAIENSEGECTRAGGRGGSRLEGGKGRRGGDSQGERECARSAFRLPCTSGDDIISEASVKEIMLLY